MSYIAAVILAHLIGDYLLQTHWMAVNKTNRWLPAIIHGVVYTLPFLFITTSIPALLVIALSHALIDRYRLAKHFSYFKNLFGPREKYYDGNNWVYKKRLWKDYKANNGYPPGTPEWLSTFLMIIADNTIHILINIGAILWL